MGRSTLSGIGHFIVFGFCLTDADERMRALKAAGFDEVLLWWGDEYLKTHGGPVRQWEMAQRHGLVVRTVHYPFTLTNALWLDNPDGRDYVEGLLSDLTLAGSMGIEHMVIHSNKGKVPPQPNPLGLERLRRVVARAEEQQVVLAIENTRYLQHQQYLYEHIDSPYLGFCFDSGHANCFTPGEDPLALFGERLVTTHLSDNFGPGPGDLHLRPGLGSIDFEALIPRIQLRPGVSLNLESAYSRADADLGLGMKEYLDASYAGILRHRHSYDAPTD